MADNTSYYLYQKYEKRGEQDPIPCYPNVYSVDGEGTKPLVIKSSADTECGAEDFITNWFAVSSYCVGVSKYETQEKGISYDNGDTWIYTGEYRDEMVEPYSEECGYIPPPPQYRTISGTPYCNQYNKYVDVYYQVSYNGGISWQTISTTSTLVETDSEDCGVIYRWQPSGETCVGYDKWEQSIKQKSYDSGITWSNVVPLETSATTLIEEDSEDCGFEPYQERWVETDDTICLDLYKFMCEFVTGTSYSAQCNYDDELTTGDTINATQPLSAMTSVVIGNCVQKVGDNAFNQFYISQEYPQTFNLSSVTLSNSVITLGERSFGNCNGLTSFNFGESLQTIESQAFYMCGTLPSVTIPKSVNYIGDGAFMYCSGLTSVTINSTNVEIENRAFQVCTSLKRINSNIDGVINIPNCVKRISHEIFGNTLDFLGGRLNSFIDTINISSGVTNIGLGGYYLDSYSNPFSYCPSLSSINVDGDNPYYNSNGNCNAIIQTASNMLISGCKNTTIPNSVVTIGGGAFAGCTGLTHITIPNSVSRIAYWAFEYCTSLTSIEIPDSVKTIGPSSFSYCRNLTHLKIGSSVRKIDEWAFSRCSGLTSVEIPDSVEELSGGTFEFCTNLTTVTIGSGLKHWGWPADFGYCSSLQSVTLHAVTPPIPVVDTWPFPSGCILYVPSESLELYRNWVVYRDHADNIQPIP